MAPHKTVRVCLRAFMCIPARLRAAAGGALTLVSSCDGERGVPGPRRWCQGRAPPVSRPAGCLRSQTGSKRSKTLDMLNVERLKKRAQVHPAGELHTRFVFFHDVVLKEPLRGKRGRNVKASGSLAYNIAIK